MKTETLAGAAFTIYTPEEVHEKIGSHEIVVIDVRTAAEYAFEHLSQALLFPMSIFDPANLPGQEGKPIVLHCGSGKRSHAMAELCAKSGFRRIAHMDGGFGAWKAAKLPYKAIDPHTGSLVLRNG